MTSRQSLFRSQAREQYARRRDKTVLPRLVMPPAFLCLWLLLGLLLLATGLAWQAQVPIYASAPGTIVPPQLNSNQPTASGPETILFVPATPTPALHVDETITLRVALEDDTFPGTVVTIEPRVLTPEVARQQYHLSGDLALLVTQPSVVVQVRLSPSTSPEPLEGLSLSAQVQVGSQSVLALLPHLLSGLFGG